MIELRGIWCGGTGYIRPVLRTASASIAYSSALVGGDSGLAFKR